NSVGTVPQADGLLAKTVTVDRAGATGTVDITNAGNNLADLGAIKTAGAAFSYTDTDALGTTGTINTFGANAATGVAGGVVTITRSEERRCRERVQRSVCAGGCGVKEGAGS